MNEPKWTNHRVTMPEDMALEYLDKLLVVVNKQFDDPGFPIALSMAIDKMRAPQPDNKALTVEPCWCKDCEYWVPDTDPEDGEQYHRCGNDDSPHGDELTGERNTCPECKRRPPEKGE